jgi:carbamoyl-phosphate synthase large subunit
VDLLFSVNDYDIALLSREGVPAIEQAGAIPVIPPSISISIAEDKMKMSDALRAAGVATPATRLANSLNSCSQTGFREAGRLVVKHRFGSGSSGLLIVRPEMLEHALALSIESAPDDKGVRAGSSRDDLVIVQEAIEGEEFGLDVVCSFDGEFQGVLARRKVRMRAGETDRAVTVDAAPFEALGRKLASSFELRGLTDVDVIVDANGDQYVIDINPRFGGGYPFCHLAGANVPACYVAWALGREIDPAWLRPEPGVMSSKYEAIRRVC